MAKGKRRPYVRPETQERLVEDMKGYENKRTRFKQDPVQRVCMDIDGAEDQTVLIAKVTSEGRAYILVFGRELGPPAAPRVPVKVMTIHPSSHAQVRTALKRVEGLITFW